MVNEPRVVGRSAVAMTDSEVTEYLAKWGILPIRGGSGEGEAGEGNGNEGEGETDNNPQSGATPEQGEEQLGEAGEKALKAERQKAKDAAKLAKDLQKQLDELKAATAKGEEGTLSELDRAAKDRDEWKGKYDGLTASLQSERVTREALEIAGKLGAVEPAAVAKLIRLDEVDFDEELKPQNVDDLLAEVKREHPRLFSAAPGNGNGGSRDARPNNEPQTAYDRLRSGYTKKR